MAIEKIRKSDLSGKEIPDAEWAEIRVHHKREDRYYVLDATLAETADLVAKARPMAKRGRPSKKK